MRDEYMIAYNEANSCNWHTKRVEAREYLYATIGKAATDAYESHLEFYRPLKYYAVMMQEKANAIRLAAEVRNNFAGQLLAGLTNPCVRCGNGRDLEPLCEVCEADMREAK